MWTLEDIIDNAGPDVIGEEHDARNIAVGGPAPSGKPSDGIRQQIEAIRSRGQWDAAEYGISAEAQIAKLEEALTRAEAFERTPEGIEAARIEAERVLGEMRQRAIRRAGLDTSTGKVAVMVAGRPAWHKLGVHVAQAVRSADAMRLASLDWSVEKVPHTYTWNGRTMTQEDSFALIRTDTGAQLGVVGSRYKPIQNAEAFGFLDGLLGEFDAKYETAGSLHGGKRVWMQVHLPRQAFALNSADRIEPYCIFENPHDGSGKANTYPTAERAVCANTLRIARAKDQGKGYGIRHTGDVRSKIKAARDALGLAIEGFGEFQQAAEAMNRTKLTVPFANYANDVLDAVLEVTAAEALKGADALAAVLAVTDAQRELEAKRLDRLIETRGDILADILTRFEQEKNATGDSRGTVWSAFNAVTESADHRNGGRKVGTAEAQLSRKMDSILTGDRDEMKQAAYTRAVAYTR